MSPRSETKELTIHIPSPILRFDYILGGTAGVLKAARAHLTVYFRRPLARPSNYTAECH